MTRRPTASTSTCRIRAWPTSRLRSAQSPGLPPDRFRLHTRDVGGGFGVRNEVYPENVAVLLAAKTVGRPVKWVGTRSESLANDHQGRGAVLTGTLALDGDGNFLAWRVEWLVNMGAYCSKNGPFINTMASPRSMANNIYKVPASVRSAQTDPDQLRTRHRLPRRRSPQRVVSLGAPGRRGGARHRHRPREAAPQEPDPKGRVSLQDADHLHLRLRRRADAAHGGARGGRLGQIPGAPA